MKKEKQFKNKVMTSMICVGGVFRDIWGVEKNAKEDGKFKVLYDNFLSLNYRQAAKAFTLTSSPLIEMHKSWESTIAIKSKTVDSSKLFKIGDVVIDVATNKKYKINYIESGFSDVTVKEIDENGKIKKGAKNAVLFAKKIKKVVEKFPETNVQLKLNIDTKAVKNKEVKKAIYSLPSVDLDSLGKEHVITSLKEDSEKCNILPIDIKDGVMIKIPDSHVQKVAISDLRGIMVGEKNESAAPLEEKKLSAGEAPMNNVYEKNIKKNIGDYYFYNVWRQIVAVGHYGFFITDDEGLSLESWVIDGDEVVCDLNVKVDYFINECKTIPKSNINEKDRKIKIKRLNGESKWYTLVGIDLNTNRIIICEKDLKHIDICVSDPEKSGDLVETNQLIVRYNCDYLSEEDIKRKKTVLTESNLRSLIKSERATLVSTKDNVPIKDEPIVASNIKDESIIVSDIKDAAWRIIAFQTSKLLKSIMLKIIIDQSMLSKKDSSVIDKMLSSPFGEAVVANVTGQLLERLPEKFNSKSLERLAEEMRVHSFTLAGQEMIDIIINSFASEKQKTLQVQSIIKPNVLLKKSNEEECVTEVVDKGIKNVV